MVTFLTIEELIQHSSFQREFSRFRQLGGQVTVDGNKIILDALKVVPAAITVACVQRIKDLDAIHRLVVITQNEA